MNNEILMVVLTLLVVCGILYFQINKLTDKIDSNEHDLKIESQKNYIKFCDFINLELENLSNLVKKDENFLNLEEKSKFLENLSSLNKEIVFIQTMHSTNKNRDIWEKKLFDFLVKMDDLIKNSLKNGDKIAENIKSKLQIEFNKL